MLTINGDVAREIWVNPRGDISLLVEGREYRLHSSTIRGVFNDGGTLETQWEPLDEMTERYMLRFGKFWRVKNWYRRQRLRASRLRWLTWPV